MFASGALARRIESAEAALTFAVGSGVRASQPQRQIVVARLGGGAGVFAGGSPFDKMIGLGFEPLKEEELAAFESAVHARGGAVQAEVSTLADPALARSLTARGYQLVGFENVLGLQLDDAAVARLQRGLDASTQVEEVHPDEIDTFVDVVSEGFSHPDTFDGPAAHESFAKETIRAVLRDVIGVPGFQAYLARQGEAVAGGASLRVHYGIAQLAGAATLPAHRRKGVQTALLRSRLVLAAEGGCDLAVVTTQPGSVSQANVMREGFSLLYSRAILLKSPR
jgi:ribosomal protein S18 acetylase RimI-like enzyme